MLRGEVGNPRMAKSDNGASRPIQLNPKAGKKLPA